MTSKFVSGLLAVAVATSGFGPRTAHALPRTLGYSFYVEGAPVGRADVKITQDQKRIVIESDTHVLTGLSVVALKSKTVADRKTFATRDFTYNGTKGELTVSGEAHVRGDSAYGFTEVNGKITEKSLKMTQPQTLLFEDWVMDHEILLALTQGRSTRKSDTYGLVFTSSFAPTEVTAGFSGEVLVEAGSRSMAARKLVVMIQGSVPFESRIDPVRGIPVYMRFPNSKAEIFLDEVFGENPATYYAAEVKK
jgi:hypothetical protein